ncbi:MAG: 3-deoxy-manno-octulosonate cytidylyltransferase [Gammaproteobacteria bacterium]|nr:3-deoxy-manno-octulosonate cytidylyltransferase [Gammaproteobacteria bacterium]
MSFIIVIPARYDSSRLPGKPLKKLLGKPLLQHVYECATRSDASEIIIATDDERIETAAKSFGADVCMTGSQHTSGTERIAEVISTRNITDDTIVVNLQGDEPMMPAACLNQVARLLTDKPECSMSTLCESISSQDDVFNPNVVKVVFDRLGRALYFSRAPIPWDRNRFSNEQGAEADMTGTHFRHIGLYAYRAGYVTKYLAAPASPVEKLESLEQLRVLWNGDQIAISEAVEQTGPGVDTENDFNQVEALMSSLT